MVRVNHDCELNIKSENLYFLPIRTRYQRICHFIRRAFMASTKNPRAHLYLRCRNVIVEERRRHLRNYLYIIHPFSVFRQWWDFLMLLTLAASLLFIPYESAFDMEMTSLWCLGKNLLLSICCTDIVINFVTGYFDKSRRVVEMNKIPITKQYILHSTFIPDLFGSLPTDLFFPTTWYHHHYYHLIVARKLTSFIHILRLFSLRTYIVTIAETYDLAPGYYDIFTFIPIFIICLHWVACVTWIVPIATGTLYANGQSSSSSSWINSSSLWTVSNNNQKHYWDCLMRTITILTRSGFLTSEPTSDEDQYIAVVLQALGILVFCYAVSQAMSLFKADNSSILKYQSTVAQLKQYMRHKQLPKSVQQRFLAYYEFRYQGQYFRESEILRTLSSQMRHEIGMHSCRKLVENVTFFNNLPVSLLMKIVAQLKSEIFLTNDVIIRAHQSGDCMYFIATGTVAIYTSTGKEICHLEDGGHFGEIALIMPDERRVATVVAVEMCELYRLERNDFMRTIYPYPLLWERIRDIAMERHEKTMIIDAR